MPSLAMVAVLLSTVQAVPAAAQKIPVLIVTGESNHDWEWTSKALERSLEATGRFDVDVTADPAKGLADELELTNYRVFVLDYNGKRWGEPAETNFLRAVAKGGTGVAVIHSANNSFPDWEEYAKLVGDTWRKGVTGHGKFHAFDLEIVDRSHPITSGLGDVRAHPDELYHELVRTPGAEHAVLATALSTKESGGTGEHEPMILVGSYGLGRVFHTPLGHVWPGVESSRASHEDPQFQKLVARGVEWAATGAVADEGVNGLVRSPYAATQDAVAGSGAWKVLFDGKSTAAWRGYGQPGFPAKGWKVAGDALVCEAGGGGGDLITAEPFGDFELEFEWRTTPKANSGVMYRVQETAAPSWNTGPEYQVLDAAYFDGKPDRMHSAGAIYDIAPAGETATALPAGQWNKGRIVVQGSKVAHFLNGVLACACDFASPEGLERVRKSKFASMPGFMKSAKGHIALQDHGDEVAYRNVRVRELGVETIRLFDGRGLGGWTWVGDGERDAVWSVAEGGVLVCKGAPTGYIRTEADYTNYVLELDWRWNPAAGGNRNSGVLLRKIEEDKIWPRSLEAQLEDQNAGDFWKIGDFPCTTAPERTNGRNCKKTQAAEKPLGEWNHYRITVDRGTVTLEVNGQVVNVATDVLEAPGKICLQSEGAEIQFKDIVLRPLH